jgi:hypothetical protein
MFTKQPTCASLDGAHGKQEKTHPSCGIAGAGAMLVCVVCGVVGFVFVVVQWYVHAVLVQLDVPAL